MEKKKQVAGRPELQVRRDSARHQVYADGQLPLGHGRAGAFPLGQAALPVRAGDFGQAEATILLHLVVVGKVAQKYQRHHRRFAG